jgi:hypothetical protein
VPVDARLVNRHGHAHRVILFCPSASSLPSLHSVYLKYVFAPDPAVIRIPPLHHSSSLDPSLCSPHRQLCFSLSLILTARVPCCIPLCGLPSTTKYSSCRLWPRSTGVHSCSRCRSLIKEVLGSTPPVPVDERSPVLVSSALQTCCATLHTNHTNTTLASPNSEFLPPRACRRIHTLAIHHG